MGAFIELMIVKFVGGEPEGAKIGEKVAISYPFKTHHNVWFKIDDRNNFSTISEVFSILILL